MSVPRPCNARTERNVAELVELYMFIDQPRILPMRTAKKQRFIMGTPARNTPFAGKAMATFEAHVTTAPSPRVGDEIVSAF